MEQIERKRNLGMRRAVGQTFYHTTKRMTKHSYQLIKSKWEILKQGDQRFLTNGKRRYFCEILGLVETRTGYYRGSIWEPKHNLNHKISGRRWYIFTYLVKIIEN